jgi:hypothetical protein
MERNRLGKIRGQNGPYKIKKKKKKIKKNHFARLYSTNRDLILSKHIEFELLEHLYEQVGSSEIV